MKASYAEIKQIHSQNHCFCAEARAHISLPWCTPSKTELSCTAQRHNETTLPAEAIKTLAEKAAFVFPTDAFMFSLVHIYTYTW